ncbi:MAG: FAD-binding protein [Oscillospiraceae bacterium]|nr:FAD-binding protein [Oscillospiraceae bacterium]
MSGIQDKDYDVIIIGAGPAGIFTAYELMELQPGASVAMLDIGRAIAHRSCPARVTGKCVNCQPCAIVHGWAGAGAFSDGKLSLSDEVGGNITEYIPHEQAMALIKHADDIYLRFGAPKTVHGLNTPKVDEIAYEASRHNIRLVPCPVRHLGTENAAKVLGAMHDALVVKIDFFERATAQELLVEDGCATGVTVAERDGSVRTLKARRIVAAPGRGGAAWLTKQIQRLGLATRSNEVDIGVRVEVPNSIMDHLTKHLYEAKLVYYSDTYENRVRTFCMNPGGVVSQEHYEGGLAVVNGHSYADPGMRTMNTNFAVLVSTRFTEPFNQPIEYGMYIAQLANMLTGGPIMVQRLGDLMHGRRTNPDRLSKSTTLPTLTTAVPGDLSFALPSRHLTSIIEALRAFDKLAPGLFDRNTLLYGVEVKFYSSKVKVDGRFETEIPGLYAIGDGAGITRGLMQASCTGVAVARDIAGRM